MAQAALLAAFESGWADPKKLGQNASAAAILRNNAIESIAHSLTLQPDQIEITGEVGLSYFLSLGGFLDPGKNLYFGAGDRSGVIATVRSHQGPKIEIPLSPDGRSDFSATALNPNSILAFQLANGETGSINTLPEQLPSDLLISVDATASGTRIPLPPKWDSAAFDSRAWGGPGGLAIVAIQNAAQWKNPLPHISSARRTYGTYSLPLLLASAVAIENFAEDLNGLRSFNQQIRSEIQGSLPATLIAGELQSSMPHLISMVFPGSNGEEVLREMANKGFAVDSGSACTAMNLQPSHVLAAMGLPTDGNIRITIHAGVTREEVDRLIKSLVETVQSQQQR